MLDVFQLQLDLRLGQEELLFAQNMTVQRQHEVTVFMRQLEAQVANLVSCVAPLVDKLIPALETLNALLGGSWHFMMMALILCASVTLLLLVLGFRRPALCFILCSGKSDPNFASDEY